VWKNTEKQEIMNQFNQINLVQNDKEDYAKYTHLTKMEAWFEYWDVGNA